jgi:hypothetical protein
LKWNKNKGTKSYVLVVDDAGVVGVLRGDVRLLFVRVLIDGNWTGARTGAWMGASTGAAAGAPAADALAATSEAAMGA